MGLLVFFLLVTVAIADQQSCFQNIQNAARAVLGNHISDKASWALNISMVVSPTTLTPVFSSNEDHFLVPASNNKIPTTAAAFTKFGTDHTFSTKIYLTGEDQICVVTGGDPELSHQGLVNFLPKLGLSTEKTYGLTVDDSLFGVQDAPYGWEFGDMIYYYGAIPTPAILDQGTVSLVVLPGEKVGDYASVLLMVQEDKDGVEWRNNIITTSNTTSVGFDYLIRDSATLQLFGEIALGADPVEVVASVHTPAKRLGYAVKNHLMNSQVYVKSVDVGPCGQSLNNSQPLGTITSNPLSTIMNHTLKVSDNLEAELFMRHLGVLNPSLDNYDAGIHLVSQILNSSLGADVSSIHQTDGSGLGRSNLLTPNGIVSILLPMMATDWVSYLPVGGESGTLADRYKGTAAQGRVKAKTGSLTGVNSLSGFVYPQNFSNDFVFSIICNGTPEYYDNVIRNLTDTIIVTIAECDSN